MVITLRKCAFGRKNKSAEEFAGQHTDRGETVCNWCAAMWGCDKECCDPRNYLGPSLHR
jgi:hypothetical protein